MLNRFLGATMMLAIAVAAGPANAAGDAKAGEEKAKQLCASCHGPDGNSIAPTFPTIAGQVPGYVADQLNLFKTRTTPRRRSASTASSWVSIPTWMRRV